MPAMLLRLSLMNISGRMLATLFLLSPASLHTDASTCAAHPQQGFPTFADCTSCISGLQAPASVLLSGHHIEETHKHSRESSVLACWGGGCTSYRGLFWELRDRVLSGQCFEFCFSGLQWVSIRQRPKLPRHSSWLHFARASSLPQELPACRTPFATFTKVTKPRRSQRCLGDLGSDSTQNFKGQTR